jgi:6-phosphogluconolactonase (cycloisomerase 2 family)
MKFRKTGRWLAASIISLSAALALTSCGSDYTVGFLFVPLAQINSMGGGGVNVFRIKHNYGNLTLMNPTPISSGGPNAVQAIVTGNGRFLYVVNQGAAPGGSSAVQLFSIGGGGVLTPQLGYGTQGTSPIALTTDSNGGHLYIVDQIAPDGAPCPNGMTQPIGATAATSLCGEITAFTVDSTTGRLSLIQNQNLTDVHGTQLTYFPVGKNPIKVVASGGFLLVLDQGDSTVFPYQIASNGQLTLTQTGPLNTGGTNLSAIASFGTSVYITDAGTNQILPYTLGSNGSLSLQNGGPVANQTGSANPDAILVAQSGKFLYVANRTNTNTNLPNSSISAFTVDPSNGKLQGITGGPYPADSGLNCLIEDPSNQYIYGSAFDNSSVVGALIRSTGQLQPLTHGTSFKINGNPNCLVASGRVN